MKPKNINPLIAEVKEYLRISLPSKAGSPFSEEFKSIKDKFMNYPTIRANYTDDDIYTLLTLSIIFKEPSFEITDKYAEEVVHSFFDVTTDDCVYVPLEEMDGFPSGYKIGTCTIITSEELPQSIKDTIHISEKHLVETNNRSEEVPLPKYWIYTKLCSVGQMKQKEEAYYKIDEALSILRLASVGTVFSCPLFIRRYYTYNSKICRHKTTFFDIYSSFPYWEGLNDKINRYTKLFYKENKSTIENTVINALKIFSLHINATSVDIEFNLVMFALEGLLLTENDKDYLGTKLSEKAAFLTEKQSRERRKEIYHTMKAMYSKRSNFVHQKKKPKKEDKITSYDLVFIRKIFLLCVEEILSLEKNGMITKLGRDKDDDKSLDDYIENLILS
ncbi:HEPN domain-containing protein [Methanosarcina barkeri]|uniref:Uncharacterized protein n=1 Tax=Methanosarcina barkeri CM1 TaxID=796385 RepID=A0A0G3C925_METBA|nr:HEPN domain-containing protein [Methanosarcina barkeri]AKJ38511.1 hypothetical protein MCM1_1465 [Methanosarcina barkeri CM1]